jgi:guanylate kinase
MSHLLGNYQQGLTFVISAPAGTGKTTLVQKLVEEFPEVVASISYTTRQPRIGEMQGKDYFFVSEEEFKKRIAASDFLEHVSLYGDFYGTSRQWIEETQKQKKHVVLVIDTQGAMLLKGKFPATFIFIRPPSLEELEKRLLQRGTENQSTLKTRLERAQIELKFAQQYDYQIVNDNLAIAYQVLKSILIAECHRSEKLN